MRFPKNFRRLPPGWPPALKLHVTGYARKAHSLSMTTNQIGRSPSFAPKQAAVRGRSIVTFAAVAAVTFTLGASPSLAQRSSDRGNGGYSQQDTQDRNHQHSGDSSWRNGDSSRRNNDSSWRDGSHGGGDNRQRNSDRGTARYHRTDGYNGMSYDNGRRHNDMSYYHGHRHNRKYYTYNGHRYFLDLGSGIRILID